MSAPLPPLADREIFVKAMGKIHRRLVEDLRTRAVDPRVDPSLREAWTADKKQRRTGESFEAYRDAFCDQVGASWVLCAVFARALEDRGYLPHRLAGPGAIERQTMFRSAFKFLGERDYLLHIFDGISLLPGAREVFGPGHAALWRLGPTSRALGELLDELRAMENGQLRFTFGKAPGSVDESGASTRYLGDLYQNLNEDVRKRYALLQTPEFVERFLLDNTLNPAIRERGHAVTVLDPACGSGHLLLGAYDRLFGARLRDEPGRPLQEVAKLALGQVFGIDLNPYAAGVARFRLLLSYLDKAGITRLQDAPQDLPLRVYVGDSLLAGCNELQTGLGDLFNSEADKLLYKTKFDVVVANPPYITEKDAAKRELIRKQYKAAAGKYALSAPFAERIFQLGNRGAYTGQITANSFMKREFGKALVEQVFPSWDLRQVIDTSNALIPGHGTPTVILFGRSQKPIDPKVCLVMGIRGEPTTPNHPANGKVWLSIAEHHRNVGFENEFISVVEVEREKLGKHPWSIGGGGAAELKELLEERAAKKLGDLATDIGFGSFPGADDVFMMSAGSGPARFLESEQIRPMITGDVVRDWCISPNDVALTPYDLEANPIAEDRSTRWYRYLWPYRTSMWNVSGFGGKTRKQNGEISWHWYRWVAERYRTPLSITFAFVATHNHFVLDRGGKAFKQTAPIIKLPEGSTEDGHLGLLGYLNSSTACFWMKQVCTKKGEGGGTRVAGGFSIMGTEEWKNNFEFGSTALLSMPLFHGEPLRPWAKAIVQQCEAALELVPQRGLGMLLARDPAIGALRAGLDSLQREYEHRLNLACALQEELDWIVYAQLGFQVPESDTTPENIGELVPSCRPVEILVAEQLQQGEKTEWFDRFGRTPHALDEACAKYPARAALLRKRMQCVAQQRELQLLERLEYKRRWESFDWDAAVKQACESFLLTRAETFFESRDPHPLPIRTIAAELHRDLQIRAVAEMLTGAANVDLEALLADLFQKEAVASASCQVYSDEGIETRRAWENVWELQRREDAGQKIDIEPPPKYEKRDFENAGTHWRLRGKLDVPKERFIAYPTATPPPGASGKPGLVFGWAGWDALRKLQAAIELWQEEMGLHGYEILPRATRGELEESASTDGRLARDMVVREKLVPILQTMVDLLPWVKQWHDEDGQTASAFEAYIAEEVRKLEMTLDEAHSYRRPAKGVAPRGRKAAAKKATSELAAAETPEEKPAKKTRGRKAKRTEGGK